MKRVAAELVMLVLVAGFLWLAVKDPLQLRAARAAAATQPAVWLLAGGGLFVLLRKGKP